MSTPNMIDLAARQAQQAQAQAAPKFQPIPMPLNVNIQPYVIPEPVVDDEGNVTGHRPVQALMLTFEEPNDVHHYVMPAGAAKQFAAELTKRASAAESGLVLPS